MNDNLHLATSRNFNGVTFDCYIERENENSGDFWATRTQIGLLLGYENPRDAIKDIHNRNKERLDKFSTQRKLRLHEDNRTVTREVIMYNFKGLLEICRYSQQENAHKVIDVLWDIADEIRHTGSYTANKLSNEELALRREELEVRKSELEYKKAQILKAMIDCPPFPLTPETQTVFAHEVFRLAAGHDYLAMLPECSEKWYTATEIGQKLGITANKVGRIAKANGLKAPEGETNEYGRWIFSKSKYSSREVPSFIYSENALDWFREFINS